MSGVLCAADRFFFALSRGVILRRHAADPKNTLPPPQRTSAVLSAYLPAVSTFGFVVCSSCPQATGLCSVLGGDGFGAALIASIAGGFGDGPGLVSMLRSSIGAAVNPSMAGGSGDVPGPVSI